MQRQALHFMKQWRYFLKLKLENELINSNQVMSFKFSLEFRNWTQECLSHLQLSLFLKLWVKIFFFSSTGHFTDRLAYLPVFMHRNMQLISLFCTYSKRVNFYNQLSAHQNIWLGVGISYLLMRCWAEKDKLHKGSSEKGSGGQWHLGLYDHGDLGYIVRVRRAFQGERTVGARAQRW